MAGTQVQATAFIDGAITPAAEAKISILDRGFLYGDSIYEVVRTYDGVPFMLDEHLARLRNSAALCSMPLAQSDGEIRAAIIETARAAQRGGRDDVFVRFTITRGSGPLNLAPPQDPKTSLIVLVKGIPDWPQAHYARGLRLAVPAVRRNSPKTLDPNIKGGNYLNNILAVQQARAVGAEDALILNLDDELAECSNSNVVLVRNGAVMTPAGESGNLLGLTKAVVMRLASEAGLEATHARLKQDDVRDATECFVTSATREIMPVGSVRLEDGTVVEFPAAEGTVYQTLKQRYAAYLEDYVREHSALRLF